MRDLLHPRNREKLIKFVSKPGVVLAFDFDGTLAPIINSRGQARMRASTRRLFRQVVKLYPCVVISGRAYRDVAKRVGFRERVRFVGNHGLEWSEHPPHATERVAEWVKSLRESLKGVSGIDIENKGLTLAIHYRASEEPEHAYRMIVRATRRLREARIVGGKAVVNVLPAHCLDKGKALLEVKRRLHCPRAFFIGDDLTDEDAFRVARSERTMLGVRVGRNPSSKAKYYVQAQREIDRVLRILGEARRG